MGAPQSPFYGSGVQVQDVGIVPGYSVQMKSCIVCGSPNNSTMALILYLLANYVSHTNQIYVQHMHLCQGSFLFVLQSEGNGSAGNIPDR